MVSQLAAREVASPTAPTDRSPSPRGIFAPENSRTAPSTSNAALIVPVTAPTGPSRYSETVSQLAAAYVASPTAPIAMRAKPSGRFTPEKARIAPSASEAALTSPVTEPIGPRSNSSMVLQLAAATATSPTAPIAISAIPRGTFTPENARRAPSAREAPLTTAVSVPIGPCRTSDSDSQFTATTVANPSAPIAISAMPNGTFAPENARSAPSTNKAPLTTAVSRPIGPCSTSDKDSQFTATTAASPSAPTAIKAIPSGMLTPENARIAPNASSATLTKAVTAPIGPFNASSIALQFS